MRKLALSITLGTALAVFLAWIADVTAAVVTGRPPWRLDQIIPVGPHTFLCNQTGVTGTLSQCTFANYFSWAGTVLGIQNFIPDSGVAPGVAGLVPAPGTGDAAAGKYLSAAGTFSVPPSAGSGISGLTVNQVAIASGATTIGSSRAFATSGANNIAQFDSGGKLLPTTLPNPAPTTLGGVQSISPVASNWLTGISTSGVPSRSQPSFADLSGVSNVALLSGTQTFSAEQTFSNGVVGFGPADISASGTLPTNACGSTIHVTAPGNVTLTFPATMKAHCNIAIEVTNTGLATITPAAGAVAHTACTVARTRTRYSLIWLHTESNAGGSAANYNVSGDCG